MSNILQGQPPLVCSEIGLVRCLGSAGVHTITGTEEPGNSALYSRYSKKKIMFSPYESERFISELRELGRKLDYKPVLMSYDDRLILNISRHRNELQEFYRFLLPDEEMVENLLDKMKFIKLADEYQLPVPASVNVSDETDLQKVSIKLKKPYLIKPIYRHHWFDKNFTKMVGSYKKAYVCHTEQELKDQYNRISKINPEVVVQEYIKGPDHNMYDVNMYINSSGDEKGSIVSQKMRVYPPTAGYGSYVVSVDDEEVLTLSRKIAAKLNLRGLVNLQFKKEEGTMEPKLIEIHTRTSIFDVLGIKSGVNTPALYYTDMTGYSRPSNGVGKFGIKYINVSRDLRYILKNRNGQTIPGLARSYLGPKVIDGFSISDPLPSIMELWWTLRHVVNKLKRKQ